MYLLHGQHTVQDHIDNSRIATVVLRRTGDGGEQAFNACLDCVC